MKKLAIPLFTALLIAGAYIKVPIPPVPITLQSMMVVLAAFTLNWKENLASALLWLFLGLIGLPVFTSGGGIAALTGPTAGYIWAMALSMPLFSAVTGALGKHDGPWVRIVLAVLMNLLIYAIGTTWLKVSRDMTFAAALAAGVTPFIIGDAVKTAAALLIAVPVSKEMKRLETKED